MNPWHWNQTDCWYIVEPGTRKRILLRDEAGEPVRGAASKEHAMRALARMASAPQFPVARIVDAYLAHCRRASASHQDNAKRFLGTFVAMYGPEAMQDIRRSHVAEWLAANESWTSASTQATAIAIVQACFNHATETFGIAHSLRGIKKPKGKPRLHSITPEDEVLLLDAASAPFRDFLFADIHTGLRPFCELATITSQCIEECDRGMMWRVYSSKTKKTRKIPVRPEVAELTRRLVQSVPPGTPIFRDSRNRPWKKQYGVVEFMATRERLGWQDEERSKYSCYSCRHTFAHRMLSGYWNGGRGCSIEVLAELIGDTPTVAFNHYGKEWAQSYQEPLWAAIGG